MLRLRKSMLLFVFLVTFVFLFSALGVHLCLAQDGEPPPAEEEKPVLESLRESLDEYLQLMSEGDVEGAFAVLEEYLAGLKELAEDPVGLSEAEAHAVHVLYVTSKHLAVLARVYEKVPEAARGGVGNALVKSTKGHANAFELAEKAEEEDADEGEEEDIEEEEEAAGEAGENGNNGQGKGNEKEKKDKK